MHFENTPPPPDPVSLLLLVVFSFHLFLLPHRRVGYQADRSTAPTTRQAFLLHTHALYTSPRSLTTHTHCIRPCGGVLQQQPTRWKRNGGGLKTTQSLTLFSSVVALGSPGSLATNTPLLPFIQHSTLSLSPTRRPVFFMPRLDHSS